MTDFLLELRSEEIPARMQDKAREDLARLFGAELDKAGLKAGEIVTYATPRRLALIAKGLPLETDAVSEETKGPKIGAPPQAMEGFLRKVGLTQDELVERDGVYFAVVEKPGRKTAEVLAEAIPAIIRAFPWPKSQRWGSASISTESLRWVRPLRGIVALLGDDVVDCGVDGIASGSATKGHRFHHSGEVTIGNAADYAMKLRAAHVIVDQEERRAIIRAGAEKAATDAGLVLVPDEGLVNENSGLTEWPVPMLGRFDPAYLEVPEEVIQLTARVNQKYFVCHDQSGKLANAFVCTANIVANDGGAAIVAGNEKVLAARLSDAKFFWEQDLKVPLDEQAKKLKQMVFHQKLGTVADRLTRVADLAKYLFEAGYIGPHGDLPVIDKAKTPVLFDSYLPVGEALGLGPLPQTKVFDDKTMAWINAVEQTALLSKADLVSGTVGEFPELQGIIGGYLAERQSIDRQIVDAIRNQYQPVGQQGVVPFMPIAVALGVADRLEYIVSLVAAGEQPTGSKDPFGIRRAMLGLIRIVLENDLRVPLADLANIIKEILYNDVFFGKYFSDQSALISNLLSSDVNYSVRNIDGQEILFFGDIARGPIHESAMLQQENWDRFLENLNGDFEIVKFATDRLKIQQRDAGVRHDVIDACQSTEEFGDLVRLLARVKALQSFITTDEGANLLAGYKRATNILKQSDVAPAEAGAAGGTAQPQQDKPTAAPAFAGATEVALLTALDSAEPKAAAAIEAEKFEDAMAALATLRAPIDAFFDGVMVNDPDPEKRAFRLGLLARFRDAVHRVADFSRIEG